MYGNWACHIYEIWRVSEPPGGEAVKGVILRKGERAYSYFSGVFSAISPAVAERNWLITGYENYPEALEPYGGNLGREAFFWVQGERLEEIVRQQDYPWYWGVLSGFKKEVPLHQVISYGLPYADGYTGFWKNPISIQHPMADIEIVAWDSALTLLISRDEAIAQAFRNAYPRSEDLETYNLGEPESEEWRKIWEEAELYYGDGAKGE